LYAISVGLVISCTVIAYLGKAISEFLKETALI